jgi:hypothetical protein
MLCSVQIPARLLQLIKNNIFLQFKLSWANFFLFKVCRNQRIKYRKFLICRFESENELDRDLSLHYPIGICPSLIFRGYLFLRRVVPRVRIRTVSSLSRTFLFHRYLLSIWSLDDDAEFLAAPTCKQCMSGSITRIPTTNKTQTIQPTTLDQMVRRVFAS